MRKYHIFLPLFLCLAFGCGAVAFSSGMVLEDNIYSQMDDAFFDETFGGEVSSVQISDTVRFSFVPQAPEGMLPNLLIELADGASLPETPEDMLTVVHSIIETAQYLQAEFPDAFIFNNALAQTYSEAGLGFTIAEPEIWLWTAARNSVLLPFYFHEQVENAFADGMYLLSLRQSVDGKNYYTLYTNPAYVAEYMRTVPLDASQSQIQTALMVWLVEQYIATSESPAETEETAIHLTVTALKANLRASASAESDVVAAVYKDERLKLLGAAENGWLEVETEAGQQGFILSSLVAGE